MDLTQLYSMFRRTLFRRVMHQDRKTKALLREKEENQRANKAAYRLQCILIASLFFVYSVSIMTEIRQNMQLPQ